jgi:hypothetical protein
MSKLVTPEFLSRMKHSSILGSEPVPRMRSAAEIGEQITNHEISLAQ